MESNILTVVQLLQWVYIVVVFGATLLVARQYLKTRQRSSLLLAVGLAALLVSQLVSTAYSLLFFTILGQGDSERIPRTVYLSGAIVLVTATLSIAGIVLVAVGALTVRKG